MFRENEIIGSYDTIGGLPTLLDISERNKLNTFNYGSGTLPSDPRLLSTIHLPLFHINLLRPTIILPPGYEKRMIETIVDVRCNEWGTGGTDVQSTKRINYNKY
jgi:hypothetical protein